MKGIPRSRADVEAWIGRCVAAACRSSKIPKAALPGIVTIAEWLPKILDEWGLVEPLVNAPHVARLSNIVDLTLQGLDPGSLEAGLFECLKDVLGETVHGVKDEASFSVGYRLGVIVIGLQVCLCSKFIDRSKRQTANIVRANKANKGAPRKGYRLVYTDKDLREAYEKVLPRARFKNDAYEAVAKHYGVSKKTVIRALKRTGKKKI